MAGFGADGRYLRLCANSALAEHEVKVEKTVEVSLRCDDLN